MCWTYINTTNNYYNFICFFYEKIVDPIWITTFGFCSILFVFSFLDDLKSIDSKIRLDFNFSVLFHFIYSKRDSIIRF